MKESQNLNFTKKNPHCQKKEKRSNKKWHKAETEQKERRRRTEGDNKLSTVKWRASAA